MTRRRWSIHPASFGVSTTVNGITIDNAFVLGPPLNSTLPAGSQAGVFLSLSTQDSGDQLLSVSAPGTASSVTLVNGPVTLTPGTLVDLTGPTPEIVLNGLAKPLNGGETVQLVLIFANAGVVTLTVPVEPHAYEYATFSPPAPSPSPSASTSAAARGERHGYAGDLRHRVGHPGAQRIDHAVAGWDAHTTDRSAKNPFHCRTGAGSCSLSRLTRTCSRGRAR